MRVKKSLKFIRHFILKINYLLFVNAVNNKLLISFSVIGLAAVTYIIFWYSVAINLENIVGNWKSHHARQGVKLSYSKMEITGFPLKFSIHLNNPQLDLTLGTDYYPKRRKKKEWIWKGRRAVVSLKPWNLNTFKLDLSGSNRFIIKNKDIIYDFISETKVFNIETELFQNTWPKKFQIKLKEAYITEKLSKKDTSVEEVFFSTGVLMNEEMVHSSTETNQNRVVKIKLKGIYLPKGLSWPIENYIEKILIELKITKNLSPFVSLKNIEKWRDSGGIIDIDIFEGVLGGLKTRGNGTLALDQNLQPLLAASANFEGIVPLVDRLDKLGFIGSKTAILAKVILGGISTRLKNGRLSVGLPLSIQNRKLSVGPVMLMTLPPINWNDD